MATTVIETKREKSTTTTTGNEMNAYDNALKQQEEPLT